MRLVTAQLGPGYVRGDRFACAGSVGPEAELTLAPQSATRALGRGAASVATTHWQVGAGGTLRILGEPLVLYPGAIHQATADVQLEPDATLVFLEVVVVAAAFASATTILRVRTANRLLIHDALRLAYDRSHGVVGSAFLVKASVDQQVTDSLLLAADEAASDAGRRHGVHLGIGSPACGGISMRAFGRCAAGVRTALNEVIARVTV